VGATVTHPHWPVFDIRLTSGDLELRPITEADLAGLVAIQPLDYETDPRLPLFGRATDPGTALHQSYWSSLGSWRPESWRLGFVVRVGGTVAGTQELEAENFARLRTVETGSWLAPAWRGRGVGKEMRRAVLALAFDVLAADAAETSAWHDNAASLGVSRSLGYVDNGVSRHAHGDRVADMPRMRMTRDVWLARHSGHGIGIEGVDGCREWFGDR
jgi:RimJ/RimL family protein N-acetyltransferase